MKQTSPNPNYQKAIVSKVGWAIDMARKAGSNRRNDNETDPLKLCSGPLGELGLWVMSLGNAFTRKYDEHSALLHQDQYFFN
ncbi:hypothetical protein CFP56_043350 [Quercus suber]|uniref:Uncharacterized protein n=1 Tax=Quercus suber TaxID=58331 RepID=A0AAW0LJ50_QUESU